MLLWKRSSIAAAALLLLAQGAAYAAETAPIVSTADGKLQGHPDKGVDAFLGVRYGADTGGENRFLPPQPPAPWTGVKAAEAWGPRCPQPPMNGAGPQVIQFSDLPVSEDCLVLNVWTPHAGAGRRPVMVWLHGGAFSFGSASDKYYEGANLSRTQHVAVISLNHRMNAFGYMPLGPEAGAKYAVSGDVGMLDIVQALRWVRANIAGFGGDPDNVTLFGQSGGGGKISVLLAMPSAQGLFRKAIIESGAVLKVSTPQEALAVRNRVLAALGLKPEDAVKLRAVPMQDLIAASAKAGLLSFNPMVDGDVLPTQPFEPTAPALSATVPLIIGTARDEVTDLLLSDPTWPKMTEADLQAKARMLLGPERGPAAVALYKARAPADQPMHLWASLFTDLMFTQKAEALATRKAAQNAAPVFVYRVDWRSPVLDGILRAPHGVELPFVFDNVDVSGELVGAGPGQAAMARLMSSSFAAFARSGDPDVKGASHWPRYDADKRSTFIFDLPPSVAVNPDKDIRALLETK